MWDYDEVTAVIGDIVLDIKKWLVKYKWKTISLSWAKQKWYQISEDLKEVIHMWQKISLRNWLNIDWR